MINPLNELSSIYNNHIAEAKVCDMCSNKSKECSCTATDVDGGDTAKPGKNKNYVKPMSEDENKIGGGNLKKLSSKASKRIDADVDGDVDTDDPKSTEMGEFVPSADGKKKVKSSAKFEHVSWKEDLREVLTNSGVDNEKNLKKEKPKKSDKSSEQIKEKDIQNKIRINPPQGVTEEFAELGGVVMEMYEIDEKIDIEKSDMGDVVKDFQKSDAPQFKGKSKKKKQEMAIAAKLNTEGRALAGVISTIRSKNGMDNVTAKSARKKQSSLDEVSDRRVNGLLKKRERQLNKALDNTSMFVDRDEWNKNVADKFNKADRSTQLADNRKRRLAKKQTSEALETGAEYHARMKEKNKQPINPFPVDKSKPKLAKKPLQQPKDSRTDAEKMTDATGPRPGSRYRGD